MKSNITSVDVGNVCDVQWFLEGYIVGMKHAGGDCPFDKDHLGAMNKAVGILKEQRDKD